jgi:hypothetical protein
LLVNGYNPLFAIAGSVLSGFYVFVAFISATITAIGYYFYSEVVAISCAGLNSIVALVALITLPLITPIA